MNKKIFVDGHVFDGEFQGSLTYIKNIYHEILSSDFKGEIIFGARNLNKVKLYFSGFKNVSYIKYNSKSGFKRIFFEIPKIINELGCTHAHFQYFIPLIKNNNCKYIATIHDILFIDFPDGWNFRWRLKRDILHFINSRFYDSVLTVSNYSKEKISSRYQIEKNKIIVTPNAVSSEFTKFKFVKSYSKNYIKKKYNINKFILSVSRIEARKNQVLLLEIFHKCKLWEQGYMLVFIGSDTFKNSAFSKKIFSIENHLKKYVRWLSEVNLNELLHFYNGAEIFVYPSGAEGFGIPPLEAASLECPVLCSNTTAMADFNFFQPYFFNPRDKNKFEKLLKSILSNKSEIDTKKIKSLIMKEYSWKLSAEEFLNKVIYND